MKVSNSNMNSQRKRNHHNFWSLILYLLLELLFLHLSLALSTNNGAHQSRTNCWSQRANRGEHDFVLECTGDGNFKPLQCDNKTGYCFCVDSFSGRPNSHTTTKNRSLNCEERKGRFRDDMDQGHQPHRHYKLDEWRVNEPGQQSSPQEVGYFPPKKRILRRCMLKQRTNYLIQLILKMKNQNRQKTKPQNHLSHSIPLGLHDQSRISDSILIGKFNEFDHDKDLHLSVDDFKLLIDNVVNFPDNTAPSIYFGCAKSMFDFCDSDQDLTIARNEFLKCFDLQHSKLLNENYIYRRRMQRLAGRNRDKSDQSMSLEHSMQEYSRIMNRESSPLPINVHTLSSSTGSLLLSEQPAQNQHNSKNNKKKDSRLDCLQTRSNSIESLTANPSGVVFIPECTVDGHYVRVQCHMMHCWCVSRVTGQPIKPINKNTTENLEACDLMRKGCDQRRRWKFHAQLRQRLNGLGLNCDSMYDQMDRNPGDHSIDDGEFQTFIKQWKPKLMINSRLHKCFRTEVHYCDQNEDGHLTKHEWRQCCHDNITITNTLIMPSFLSSSHQATPSGSISRIENQLNQFVKATLLSANKDSRLFPGSTYPSSVAEAYHQKKNRPRLGPNPLKILKSE